MFPHSTRQILRALTNEPAAPAQRPLLPLARPDARAALALFLIIPQFNFGNASDIVSIEHRKPEGQLVSRLASEARVKKNISVRGSGESFFERGRERKQGARKQAGPLFYTCAHFVRAPGQAFSGIFHFSIARRVPSIYYGAFRRRKSVCCGSNS